VLAKLVVKGTTSASRLWLARQVADLLADALHGRDRGIRAWPPGLADHDRPGAGDGSGQAGSGLRRARSRAFCRLSAMPWA
jgi:hypothetical protein